MSALVTRIRARGGTVVRLAGVLDEVFDPADISGDTGIVIFDLEEVRRVTSSGVKQWITGLQQLAADYYCFVRCHPPVVAQFNMVNGFAVDGELVTLYAPFTCTRCESATESLIDLRRRNTLQEILDGASVGCPNCASTATFDDIVELYFRFALSTRRPSPPASASAIIDGMARH